MRNREAWLGLPLAGILLAGATGVAFLFRAHARSADQPPVPRPDPVASSTVATLPAEDSTLSELLQFLSRAGLEFEPLERYQADGRVTGARLLLTGAGEVAVERYDAPEEARKVVRFAEAQAAGHLLHAPAAYYHVWGRFSFTGSPAAVTRLRALLH